MNTGSLPNRTLRLRELLTSSLLFLATATFVLWQNAHIAVLWDLSYLLDTSWRIALGQVPYRDFPLVHPPLTFLVQAALIRLFGRVYLVPIGYAAVAGGLGTVLTWRIVLGILRLRVPHAWPIALLLAAPLVFVGIYGIYPHPIYDCDCALALLVAIYALQRIEQQPGRPGRAFTAGVLAALPVFFKQNMGLPFLLLVVFAALVLLAMPAKIGRATPGRRPMAALLCGIVAALVVGLGAIQLWVGLGNYFHWTVTFAGQRRLPGVADMLTIYRQPSFLWTIPTLAAGLLLLHSRYANRLRVRIAAVCLFSAPFIESLFYLLREDDLDERADHLLALWPLLLIAAAVYALLGLKTDLRKGLSLSSFLPFMILAAIHGTLLSQQLWGSTYAIWPLLIILIAGILASFSTFPPRQHLEWPRMAFAAAISTTFLVCGALYAIGHERLNYVQLPTQISDLPAGKSNYSSHSGLPTLRGMSIPGTYLADFEELIEFTNREIPAQEGILLLPGEEPFFYATGRTPQFPVQIFDLTTDPYSPAELMNEARKRNIRWVIVKHRLQLNEDPLPAREQTMDFIKGEFLEYTQIGGYDVYKRR